MKTFRLQAAFARKREADHLRTEQTTAINRYYDHWGKVTSRYENWTTPEYYKQAEEKLKQTKEKKQNEENLKQRREKLKELLMREKVTYEEQLAALRKPKSRNMKPAVMEKIDQDFKAQQNDKRRLDLEAKLYGRWRHGVDDEGLLYESKSQNQTLAKLNWLDRQIENQMQQEQQEKYAQDQNLKLQEEIRKTEQSQKERQQIREKEIKEIRALQEKHMEEYKNREREAESLKSEAEYVQNSLEHLNTELTILENSNAPNFQAAFLSNNLSKIKMIIRKQSESFRHQLESDIDLLQRINKICEGEPMIYRLIAKFEQQREVETHSIGKIESMYESEAKINLQICEEAWLKLTYERRSDLINLLKDLESKLTSKLNANRQRQKDLIEIRTTHLSSIENSNDRLKLLIQEQNESPRLATTEISTPTTTPRILREPPCKPIHNISNSFTNLNLDCLGGEDVDQPPQSARSQQVVTPDSAQRPKFGRKRVAWI